MRSMPYSRNVACLPRVQKKAAGEKKTEWLSALPTCPLLLSPSGTSSMECALQHKNIGIGDLSIDGSYPCVSCSKAYGILGRLQCGGLHYQGGVLSKIYDTVQSNIDQQEWKVVCTVVLTTSDDPSSLAGQLMGLKSCPSRVSKPDSAVARTKHNRFEGRVVGKFFPTGQIIQVRALSGDDQEARPFMWREFNLIVV
ncbi:hypothetical protein SAY86_001967 [Trapa natans]|uniref:Uncharacterized protein n=1 Tax=Trapa natans TaxID=22666 RepID=A0AAN7LCG3_TRANT|nr:hypothetical protein SAY86_001967 [Trapa natans]